MADTTTSKDDIKLTETPPDDDVWSICFGDFTLPCRSNCCHWFCGSCILQVWNHDSAFQPCKCPMCCRHIKNLAPEASVYYCYEDDAKTILKAVGKYNRLFVGGIHGFILVMVGFIYMVSPFDFIPPGVDVLHLCNCSAVLLVGLLKSVGLYRARRAAQHARQIAAAELLIGL